MRNVLLLCAVVFFIAGCQDREFNVFEPTNHAGPTTVLCPSGFTGSCNTARWSDAGLSPADTIITAVGRYNIRGLAYIPFGMSQNILVRSALGCTAVSSPIQVISTSVTNVYTVSIEMQGIATCADSTIVKLAADSSQRKAVHVSVISATGTLTLNQPSPLGGVGATGKYTCTWSGGKCRYYSTQPLIAAIVAKDTTFLVLTYPWPLGPNVGGQYKNLNSGTGNMCAFDPNKPSVMDCKSHTVSSGVSGSSLRGEAVILYDWPVPEALQQKSWWW